MKRSAVLLAGLALLPSISFAARSPQGIIVIGADLGAARAAYAAASALPRRDCDTAGDGRWLCASYDNPTLAQYLDATSVQSQPAAVPSAPAALPVPTDPAPTPVADGRVAVVGSSLSEARERFSRTTSLRRADCDQASDGRWICASFSNPGLSDVGVAGRLTGDSAGGGDQPVAAPAAPTPAPLPTPSNGARSLPGDALYARGDLIVLNYDSCPDRDDIHAAVAGRMVVDYYGLELGSDYIVNNGACGDRRPRSDYLTDSPRMFTVLYGREGSTNTWQDVFYNESRGARLTAEKMAIALTQGRKVWVMEGGPSDFTFEVLKLVERLNPGVSLKNIVVVQHSAGFNQREADQSHLAYVRSVTDYRLIDDGNNRNNRTPQLNQNHRDSSRYSAPDASIIARFRDNAVYGSAWRVAFDLFDPNERFDGSDTVELLWILGLQSNDIAGWSDFSNRFLPSGGSSTPSAPRPTATVAPSTPAPVSSSLRAQIESATLRGGWERTADGAVWLGPDRYSLSRRGDDANLSFTLDVPAAGRYRFTMRSRATPRGLTAERYGVEPPNDIWVTFGDRSWIKAYMNRDGQWHTTAIGELGSSNHSASNLESDLPAGPVIVTISGRSRGHEVDYIELVRVR